MAMMTTCLITGGAGNLACQLSWLLASSYDRILLADVATQPVGTTAPSAVFERVDLTDRTQMEAIFVKYKPVAVVHLASLLSGSCEANRQQAWQVNMNASFSLFELGLRHGCPKILFTSSVATYGGDLPPVLANDTPQWPGSLYGVTKVAVERLGNYYRVAHGMDFRCLRLPITISRNAPPGAASAFASHSFIAAVTSGKFVFRVAPQIKLAMIYVRDALLACTSLLGADPARVKQPAYNVGAMTATPQQISQVIQSRLPHVQLRFEEDEKMTRLVAGWPGEIDDGAARNDWGWSPAFDLERTADHFLAELQPERDHIR